jgi:tripeptide aminopeptidase
MINQARLRQEFIQLVTIDSLSRQEGRVAAYVQQRLRELGAEVTTDNAGSLIGGECGNIIAHFSGGGRSRLPLMLNAHLDTVKPGAGIKPLYHEGKFHTSGETILGADDKSGIAIILEALRVLKEQDALGGNLGLVFTVAEEIGLLGAKHLDYSRLGYKYCLSYDNLDRHSIITRAPAANRLRFKLYGREAHAGVNPEKGINAIWLASQGIAQMHLGRIDSETTANIGTIQGGTATNIVPNQVELAGETRSHNLEKLEQQTQHMRQALIRAVSNFGQSNGLPRLEEEITQEYPLMRVADSSQVVQLVQQAAQNLEQKLKLTASGGGSDANIFNGQGIETIIMGTGMQNAHSTAEFITLADMVEATRLLVEIIRTNTC